MGRVFVVSERKSKYSNKNICPLQKTNATLATRMASPIAQPMPPFDPDVDIGQNIAPRWKIWIEDFKTYLVANDITDKKRQRALLLYQAGSRVREIFRQLPDTGEDDDIHTAIEKLNSYFEPQKHRLYEVYKFRQTRQEVNESIDQYYPCWLNVFILRNWTSCIMGYIL